MGLGDLKKDGAVLVIGNPEAATKRLGQNDSTQSLGQEKEKQERFYLHISSRIEKKGLHTFLGHPRHLSFKHQQGQFRICGWSLDLELNILHEFFPGASLLQSPCASGLPAAQRKKLTEDDRRPGLPEFVGDFSPEIFLDYTLSQVFVISGEVALNNVCFPTNISNMFLLRRGRGFPSGEDHKP